MVILEANAEGSEQPVTSINILTLNCWGLKYISKYRSERLGEIGRRLAEFSPQLEIVGLQECWTYADYASIRKQTRHILPYGKFYHSGIFGGGLVILSKWPLEESSMFRYPLNGRPTAYFRGDWFVGKGVATARIRMPGGQPVEVFNTHLHAPYEREPNDSYICHRTAQAWEIARLMRDASERGSLVIALGDFNMVPMSFAHVLIETRSGGAKDAWRVLHPGSSVGASIDIAEAERRKSKGEKEVPTVRESLDEHGHTCDSVVNTWRWTDDQRKALKNGTDRVITSNEPDPKAKRLDYIFFNDPRKHWRVTTATVVMTERHPILRCSLTDHFAVQATVVQDNRKERPLTNVDVGGLLSAEENSEAKSDIVDFEGDDIEKALSPLPTQAHIATSFYQEIIAMIHKYTLRERKQRRWRLTHFVGSALISIGCFIAIWWSPRNYVSFILILLSSLGLMAGTVDGLIGGLFVGSELRALQEFEWEVRNALQLAGGPVNEEGPLRDWYD
jgi:sphingomyelin phosphodiesterase 2